MTKPNKYLDKATAAFAVSENPRYGYETTTLGASQAIAAAAIVIAQELKRFNDRDEWQAIPEDKRYTETIDAYEILLRQVLAVFGSFSPSSFTDQVDHAHVAAAITTITRIRMALGE